jgi:hypothetical protein
MTSYKSKGSWTLAGSEAIKSPIEGTRRYRTSDAPWEPTQLDGFWIKSLYELLRSRGVRWPGPCRMRETFRSTQSIAAGALPAPFAGARPLGSALPHGDAYRTSAASPEPGVRQGGAHRRDLLRADFAYDQKSDAYVWPAGKQLRKYRRPFKES